jgi:exopolysaccharide biosynthesis polyprenyl glycosylphosphotransferase
MAVDALVVVGTGYVAYSISLEAETGTLVMAWDHFMGTLLFLMFVCNYCLGSFGFYSEKRFSSNLAMMRSLFIAVSLSFFVLAGGVVLLGIRPFSRVFVFSHFLMVLCALMITRITLYFYLDQRAHTAFNSRQILLVGSGERIGAVAEALRDQRSWGHQVVGCLRMNGECNPGGNPLRALGDLGAFDRVLKEHGVDEVVFALPKGSPVKLETYLDKCERFGVAVRIVPAMVDLGHPVMRVENIGLIPTLALYTSGFSNASGFMYKRVLDLVAGIVGFLIFLVIYPAAALAIRLDSPGPVLFKQKRVARNGRVFNLYKFRSMITDAEAKKKDLLGSSEMKGPIFKMGNDPRVTRVGRFLRKTSLDEFPQFINVLKGEMSLVGTRPPTPDEVEQYEDWHRRRISIKPGLTGMWQISGRNKITDFNEIVKLDLRYIDGWRFWDDLIILWKTIWVVLARKGAR